MGSQTYFHDQLAVSSHKTIEPTPDILEALQQNYKLEASIADLVDNSIDAESTSVLIRFVKRGGRLVSLCVVDNGKGMTEANIDGAMQFGNRRNYRDRDLGMFGVGLKTASLSQATALAVMSRTDRNRTAGRRWSETGIKAHAWRCDVISAESTEAELGLDWGFIGRLKKGTVVRWDNVRDFKIIRPHGVEAYLENAMKAVGLHVGLKLHRFLGGSALDLRIDVLDADNGETSIETRIAPIDPFPREEAVKGYPKKFSVEIPDLGVLTLKASIWPRKSTSLGYRLGTGKVAEHQGFYFYRRDRLIQPGGWNGWKSTTEPHASLARVAVDIPDGMGAYLKVRSNKAGVDAPASFSDCLDTAKAQDGTTLQEYFDQAEAIYRTRAEQTEKPILRPGKGIPRPVQAALERQGVPFKRGNGMSIVWGRVDGKNVFEIDRENDVVTLNERYRKVLNRGETGAADVPVIRTLIYFLLSPTLERERGGVAEDGKLRAIQAALIEAVGMERPR
jgi:hypothetical protein